MTANLKEIARSENVPYSTIAGWIGRGIIQPSRRSGRSGAVIVLDENNVTELKNLIRLRKGGLPLQRARHLIEDLRAAGYNPLSQGIFVVLDRRKGSDRIASQVRGLPTGFTGFGIFRRIAPVDLSATLRA